MIISAAWSCPPAGWLSLINAADSPPSANARCDHRYHTQRSQRDRDPGIACRRWATLAIFAGFGFICLTGCQRESQWNADRTDLADFYGFLFWENQP
jgi:hypothetical protein